MTPYELAKFMEVHNFPILDLVRKHRPYRIPKNYLQWRALSAIVALCVETSEHKETADLASYFNANRTALWFLQDAPIYCLKKELLRDFEKSSVEDNPKLLADLRHPCQRSYCSFRKTVLFPQKEDRSIIWWFI